MITMSEPKAPGGISSSLAAWFDPAKGVNQNTSNQVEAWTDISTNGGTVNQATTTYYPDWKESALNGNPALYFDGGDEHLDNVDLNILSNTSDATIFVVGQNETYASTDVLVTFDDVNGYEPGFFANGTSIELQDDLSSPVSIAAPTTVVVNQSYLFDTSWIAGVDQNATVSVDGVTTSVNTMDIDTINT